MGIAFNRLAADCTAKSDPDAAMHEQTRNNVRDQVMNAHE